MKANCLLIIAKICSVLEIVINAMYVKYICYSLSNSLNAFVGKKKKQREFYPR